MSFDSTTFRLFKNTHSFTDGMASLLDFSSPTVKFNMSKSDSEADGESIHADWLAIGADMKEAISEYDSGTKS